MPDYSLELANSTARVNCTCCAEGMTSVCGFISKSEQPYSVYYALIHNNRKDTFVRLSISVGDWWRHDTYENRFALCIDVTPNGKNWRMSVQDPIYSPQQNFAKFGRWLSRKEGWNSPAIQQLVEVANFIVAHDPAVLTYLTERRPDFTGRNVQQATAS
jgi:hypothetical protein